jgi:hypothetical protein
VLARDRHLRETPAADYSGRPELATLGPSCIPVRQLGHPRAQRKSREPGFPPRPSGERGYPFLPSPLGGEGLGVRGLPAQYPRQESNPGHDIRSVAWFPHREDKEPTRRWFRRDIWRCSPNRQLARETLVGIEPTSEALQATASPSGSSVSWASVPARSRTWSATFAKWSASATPRGKGSLPARSRTWTATFAASCGIHTTRRIESIPARI